MTGRSPKVVVVGSTYVDMVIRCGQIPSAGQSVSGSALSYIATGPGPNQAVEAALCGCDVHLISKVGGGPFGQMVKANLAEFNVNTDFVYTAEAKNTGVVVTLVNAEGENTSLTYTGANSALLPQDIESAEQIISEADVCLIHGELPQDAVITAIKDMGISEDRIETVQYSVQPNYDWDRRMTVGYRVTNMVQVEILDLRTRASIIGDIIDTATDAGANNIQGISFGLTDDVIDELEREAYVLALGDASGKAQLIAETLELTITGVHSVSESTYYPYSPYRDVAVAFESGASTPIIEGSLSISVTVQVAFTFQ